MISDSFSKFIAQISDQSVFVIDPEITISKYVSLDLSIDNKKLNQVDVANVDSLRTYVNSEIKASNGSVAYGGYLEQRAIYDRSDYFNSENKEAVRNIHLGMDLWLEAGSSIYVPIDGIVHSFKNNLNFGDYGPTIILQHTIQNQSFYTLYGHLSEESIQSISLGQPFKASQKLATLGSEHINGNYPPHLHFQIIKDIQSNFGDYPGVCNFKNMDFYKNNCPDPNLLLKIY